MTMPSRREAIAVIGAGTVGSILAAHLASVGREVLVVECNPRFDQVRRDGLTIGGMTDVSARPGTVLKTVRELGGPSERVAACLICTKTWSLRELLPELQQVLHPETMVISCQNGVGTEDEIARFFPANRVGRAIVNFAGRVARDTGETVMQWFNPPNYLGAVDGDDPRVVAIASALTQSGLTTELVSNGEVRKMVFLKTILNSALNALCACCGVTMRQAMTHAHTRRLARDLIREGLSVASALGYFYGQQAEEDCLRYLGEGNEHLPSMWYDLQAQSPTEIEYINGSIVRLGQMFKNVDVSVNRFLTSIIVTHEIRYGARRPEDIPEYLVRS
jgi:2-dehydropantoate 2-reductase